MSTNRITVQTIQIKNFRSIRNAKIDCKDMNVFVGQNDVGKSNVLKALNLFFNGKCDYEKDFDFKQDFTYYFPKNSHNTREIVISIDFLIPASYKEHGIITWKKTWRVNDFFRESITDKHGKEPSARTRVISSLRRMKYRYVPAVKSKEYYKSLLSDLYITVSSVLDSPLEKSVNEFSTVIKNYTKQISQDVSESIGLKSALSMPENMTELFKTLIFETKDKDSKVASIPLELRGDGIQARHIPIILKYIADEDQKTRNQGSVKVSTIWGFEEPENGVELLKAFDMANDFLSYSEEIQMFITTHSPAFYMIERSETVQVLYATGGENISDGTRLCTDIRGNKIGETMGLLPIVAPYIKEEEKKYRFIKDYLISNSLLDIPTIFVEGKTDKEYIENAIMLFSDKLRSMLNNKRLRVFNKEGEGGCLKLVHYGLAWIHSGCKNKAYIIFDQDDAGKRSRKLLTEDNIYRKENDDKVNASLLKPSNAIIDLKQSLAIDFEIEHLLSTEFWEAMKEKGYTKERESDELCSMLECQFDKNKLIEDSVKEKVSDNQLLNTIVLNNPRDEKKTRILNMLLACDDEQKKIIMAGFIPTIKDIEKFFC